MKDKRSGSSERVGLTLHKHLVPEVLDKAPALDMNPNEFVNACVEECVNAMLQKEDPGPGAAGIVHEFRSRTGKNPPPEALRLNGAEYALLRSLEEILYDLKLAKECVLSRSRTSAILTPAIVELLRKYQEHRTLLLGMTPMYDGKHGYPAPASGI